MSKNNGPEVNLSASCGIDEAALAALLRGVKICGYVIDKDFRVRRADAPLSLLLGSAFGKDIAIPGGNLLDAVRESDRAHWNGYLREMFEGSAGTREGYVYASREEDEETGRSSFICVAPRAMGDGKSVKKICFAVMEVLQQELANALGDPEKAGVPMDEEGLTVAKQLAATLNHEINNPLFIVSATLEDLLADPLDPEMRRRLQVALDKTWQAVEAVKQLQDVRQIVQTSYIPGVTMIDLEASSRHKPKPAKNDPGP
jgi:signal transduction histidine kinase